MMQSDLKRRLAILNIVTVLVQLLTPWSFVTPKQVYAGVIDDYNYQKKISPSKAPTQSQSKSNDDEEDKPKRKTYTQVQKEMQETLEKMKQAGTYPTSSTTTTTTKSSQSIINDEIAKAQKKEVDTKIETAAKDSGRELPEVMKSANDCNNDRSFGCPYTTVGKDGKTVVEVAGYYFDAQGKAHVLDIPETINAYNELEKVVNEKKQAKAQEDAQSLANTLADSGTLTAYSVYSEAYASCMKFGGDAAHCDKEANAAVSSQKLTLSSTNLDMLKTAYDKIYPVQAQLNQCRSQLSSMCDSLDTQLYQVQENLKRVYGYTDVQMSAMMVDYNAYVFDLAYKKYATSDKQDLETIREYVNSLTRKTCPASGDGGADNACQIQNEVVNSFSKTQSEQKTIEAISSRLELTDSEVCKSVGSPYCDAKTADAIRKGLIDELPVNSETKENLKIDVDTQTLNRRYWNAPDNQKQALLDQFPTVPQAKKDEIVTNYNNAVESQKRVQKASNDMLNCGDDYFCSNQVLNSLKSAEEENKVLKQVRTYQNNLELYRETLFGIDSQTEVGKSVVSRCIKDSGDGGLISGGLCSSPEQLKTTALNILKVTSPELYQKAIDDRWAQELLYMAQHPDTDSSKRILQATCENEGIERSYACFEVDKYVKDLIDRGTFKRVASKSDLTQIQDGILNRESVVQQEMAMMTMDPSLTGVPVSDSQTTAICIGTWKSGKCEESPSIWEIARDSWQSMDTSFRTYMKNKQLDGQYGDGLHYGELTNKVINNSYVYAAAAIWGKEKAKELVDRDGNFKTSSLSTEDAQKVAQLASEIRKDKVTNVGWGFGKVSAEAYSANVTFFLNSDQPLDPYIGDKVYVDGEMISTAAEYRKQLANQKMSNFLERVAQDTAGKSFLESLVQIPGTYFDVTAERLVLGSSLISAAISPNVSFSLLRFGDRTFAPNSAAYARDQMLGDGRGSVNDVMSKAGMKVDFYNSSYSDLSKEEREIYELASKSVAEYNQSAASNAFINAKDGLQNVGAMGVGALAAILSGGSLALGGQIIVDLSYDIISQSILNANIDTADEKFVRSLQEKAKTSTDPDEIMRYQQLATVADENAKNQESQDMLMMLAADAGFNVAGEGLGSMFGRMSMMGKLTPTVEEYIARTSITPLTEKEIKNRAKEFLAQGLESGLFNNEKYLNKLFSSISDEDVGLKKALLDLKDVQKLTQVPVKAGTTLRDAEGNLIQLKEGDRIISSEMDTAVTVKAKDSVGFTRGETITIERDGFAPMTIASKGSFDSEVRAASFIDRIRGNNIELTAGKTADEAGPVAVKAEAKKVEIPANPVVKNIAESEEVNLVADIPDNAVTPEVKRFQNEGEAKAAIAKREVTEGEIVRIETSDGASEFKVIGENLEPQEKVGGVEPGKGNVSTKVEISSAKVKTPVAPRSFISVEEANTAIKNGEVAVGQTISVDGKKHIVMRTEGGVTSVELKKGIASLSSDHGVGAFIAKGVGEDGSFGMSRAISALNVNKALTVGDEELVLNEFKSIDKDVNAGVVTSRDKDGVWSIKKLTIDENVSKDEIGKILDEKILNKELSDGDVVTIRPADGSQTKWSITSSTVRTKENGKIIDTKITKAIEIGTIDPWSLKEKPTVFSRIQQFMTSVQAAVNRNAYELKTSLAFKPDRFEVINLAGRVQYVPKSGVTYSTEELLSMNLMNRKAVDMLSDSSGYIGLRYAQLDSYGKVLQVLDKDGKVLLTLPTGGGKNTVANPLTFKINMMQGKNGVQLFPENLLQENIALAQKLEKYYGDVYVFRQMENGERAFFWLDGRKVDPAELEARVKRSGKSSQGVLILSDYSQASYAIGDVRIMRFKIDKQLESTVGIARVWDALLDGKTLASGDELGQVIGGQWSIPVGEKVAVMKLPVNNRMAYGLTGGGNEVLRIHADTRNFDIVEQARNGSLKLEKDIATSQMKPLSSDKSASLVKEIIGRIKQDASVPADSWIAKRLVEIEAMTDPDEIISAFNGLKDMRDFQVASAYAGKTEQDAAKRAISLANAYTAAAYSRLDTLSKVVGNDLRFGEDGLVKLASGKSITRTEYNDVMMRLSLQDEGVKMLEAKGINVSSAVALGDLEVSSKSVVTSIEDTMAAFKGGFIAMDATDGIPTAKLGLRTTVVAQELHAPARVVVASNVKGLLPKMKQAVWDEFNNGRVAFVVDTNVLYDSLDETTDQLTKQVAEDLNPNQTILLAMMDGDTTNALYRVDNLGRRELIGTYDDATELYNAANAMSKQNGDEKILAISQNRTRGLNFKPQETAANYNKILLLGDSDASIADITRQSAGRLRDVDVPEYHFFGLVRDADRLKEFDNLLTAGKIDEANQLMLSTIYKNQAAVEANLNFERGLSDLRRNQKKLVQDLRAKNTGNKQLQSVLDDVDQQVSENEWAFKTIPTNQKSLKVMFDEYTATRNRLISILDTARANGASPALISDLEKAYGLSSSSLTLADFETIVANPKEYVSVVGDDLDSQVKRFLANNPLPEYSARGSAGEAVYVSQQTARALTTSESVTKAMNDAISAVNSQGTATVEKVGLAMVQGMIQAGIPVLLAKQLVSRIGIQTAGMTPAEILGEVVATQNLQLARGLTVKNGTGGTVAVLKSYVPGTAESAYISSLANVLNKVGDGSNTSVSDLEKELQGLGVSSAHSQSLAQSIVDRAQKSPFKIDSGYLTQNQSQPQSQPVLQPSQQLAQQPVSQPAQQPVEQPAVQNTPAQPVVDNSIKNQPAPVEEEDQFGGIINVASEEKTTTQMSPEEQVAALPLALNAKDKQYYQLYGLRMTENGSTTPYEEDVMERYTNRAEAIRALPYEAAVLLDSEEFDIWKQAHQSSAPLANNQPAPLSQQETNDQQGVGQKLSLPPTVQLIVDLNPFASGLSRQDRIAMGALYIASRGSFFGMTLITAFLTHFGFIAIPQWAMLPLSAVLMTTPVVGLTLVGYDVIRVGSWFVRSLGQFSSNHPQLASWTKTIVDTFIIANPFKPGLATWQKVVIPVVYAFQRLVILRYIPGLQVPLAMDSSGLGMLALRTPIMNWITGLAVSYDAFRLARWGIPKIWSWVREKIRAWQASHKSVAVTTFDSAKVNGTLQWLAWARQQQNLKTEQNKLAFYAINGINIPSENITMDKQGLEKALEEAWKDYEKTTWWGKSGGFLGFFTLVNATNLVSKIIWASPFLLSCVSGGLSDLAYGYQFARIMRSGSEKRSIENKKWLGQLDEMRAIDLSAVSLDIRVFEKGASVTPENIGGYNALLHVGNRIFIENRVFTITSVLADGTLGREYIAENAEGKKVVVKLFKNTPDNEDFSAADLAGLQNDSRLMNSSQIHAMSTYTSDSMNHGVLPRLEGIIEDGSQTVGYVMEYIDGKSLGKTLSDQGNKLSAKQKEGVRKAAEDYWMITENVHGDLINSRGELHNFNIIFTSDPTRPVVLIDPSPEMWGRKAIKVEGELVERNLLDQALNKIETLLPTRIPSVANDEVVNKDTIALEDQLIELETKIQTVGKSRAKYLHEAQDLRRKLRAIEKQNNITSASFGEKKEDLQNTLADIQHQIDLLQTEVIDEQQPSPPFSQNRSKPDYPQLSPDLYLSPADFEQRMIDLEGAMQVDREGIVQSLHQVITTLRAEKEGYVVIDNGQPTLVLSDLHARRDFLGNALERLVDGQRVIDLLEAGKVNLVCLGDGMHSEVADNWTSADFSNEFADSLDLMQMVMDLKVRFPENFHYLRGNHDDLSNKRVSKFGVRMNEKMEQEMEQRLGDDFVQQWMQFERLLPMVAIETHQDGSAIVMSHAAPGKVVTREKLAHRVVSKETVNALTWTDNRPLSESPDPTKWISDTDVADNMYAMYTSFGLKPEKTKWIIGHRDVPGHTRFRLQVGETLIQIGDKEKQLAYFIPALGDMNPLSDVVSLNDQQPHLSFASVVASRSVPAEKYIFSLGSILGRRVLSRDMDGKISNQQLKIDYTKEGYFLTDVKSTHGTRVNGKLIGGNREGGKVPIQVGDVIEVGWHTRFRITELQQKSFIVERLPVDQVELALSLNRLREQYAAIEQQLSLLGEDSLTKENEAKLMETGLRLEAVITSITEVETELQRLQRQRLKLLSMVDEAQAQQTENESNALVDVTQPKTQMWQIQRQASAISIRGNQLSKDMWVRFRQNQYFIRLHPSLKEQEIVVNGQTVPAKEEISLSLVDKQSEGVIQFVGTDGFEQEYRYRIEPDNSQISVALYESIVDSSQLAQIITGEVVTGLVQAKVQWNNTLHEMAQAEAGLWGFIYAQTDWMQYLLSQKEGYTLSAYNNQRKDLQDVLYDITRIKGLPAAIDVQVGTVLTRLEQEDVIPNSLDLVETMRQNLIDIEGIREALRLYWTAQEGRTRPTSEVKISSVTMNTSVSVPENDIDLSKQDMDKVMSEAPLTARTLLDNVLEGIQQSNQDGSQNEYYYEAFISYFMNQHELTQDEAQEVIANMAQDKEISLDDEVVRSATMKRFARLGYAAKVGGEFAAPTKQSEPILPSVEHESEEKVEGNQVLQDQEINENVSEQGPLAVSAPVVSAPAVQQPAESSQQTPLVNNQTGGTQTDPTLPTGFPTTIESATQGYRSYMEFEKSLNIFDRILLLGYRQQVKNVFIGVYPESGISDPPFFTKWRVIQILKKAVAFNPNVVLLYSHASNYSDYSLVNLEALERVARANQDIFPLASVLVNGKINTDWVIDLIAHNNSSKTNLIRFGLISGFPRSAADMFAQENEELQAIRIKKQMSHESFYKFGSSLLQSYYKGEVELNSVLAEMGISKSDIPTVLQRRPLGIGFVTYSDNDIHWGEVRNSLLASIETKEREQKEVSTQQSLTSQIMTGNVNQNGPPVAVQQKGTTGQQQVQDKQTIGQWLFAHRFGVIASMLTASFAVAVTTVVLLVTNILPPAITAAIPTSIPTTAITQMMMQTPQVQITPTATQIQVQPTQTQVAPAVALPAANPLAQVSADTARTKQEQFAIVLGNILDEYRLLPTKLQTLSEFVNGQLKQKLPETFESKILNNADFSSALAELEQQYADSGNTRISDVAYTALIQASSLSENPSITNFHSISNLASTLKGKPGATTRGNQNMVFYMKNGDYHIVDTQANAFKPKTVRAGDIVVVRKADDTVHVYTVDENRGNGEFVVSTISDGPTAPQKVTWVAFVNEAGKGGGVELLRKDNPNEQLEEQVTKQEELETTSLRDKSQTSITPAASIGKTVQSTTVGRDNDSTTIQNDLLFAQRYRELPHINTLVTPKEIIIHSDGGDGTVENTYNDLVAVVPRDKVILNENGQIKSIQPGGETRSSNVHFAVGRDGRTTQFLPMYAGTVTESYGALGHPEVINIEVGGTTNMLEQASLSETQMSALVDLVIDLMTQYNIPLDSVVPHSDRDVVTFADGTTRDRSKPDPGSAFMDILKKRLAGKEGDSSQTKNVSMVSVNPRKVTYNAQIPQAYLGSNQGIASNAELVNGKRVWKQEEAWAIADEDMPNVSFARSADNLSKVINWFNVADEQNRRYRADTTSNGITTFCNIFVWDATRALGVEIPRWLDGNKQSANNMGAWLRGDGGAYGWEEVTAEEAQQLADGGTPTVAVMEWIGKTGHIAMVIPGKGEVVDGIFYPTSAQAGRINFVGKSTYEGFEGGLKNGQKIRYYANKGNPYKFVSQQENSLAYEPNGKSSNGQLNSINPFGIASALTTFAQSALPAVLPIANMIPVTVMQSWIQAIPTIPGMVKGWIQNRFTGDKKNTAEVLKTTSSLPPFSVGIVRGRFTEKMSDVVAFMSKLGAKTVDQLPAVKLENDELEKMEMIGVGSTANVYRSAVSVNGKEILAAIKIFIPLNNDPEEIDNSRHMFEYEVLGAQLLSQLGIGPRFFGVVETVDGQFGYVMEEVQGDFSDRWSPLVITDSVIKQLEVIDEKLKRVNVDIADFQFIITPEGKVVVIDPGRYGIDYSDDRTVSERVAKERQKLAIIKRVTDLFYQGVPRGEVPFVFNVGDLSQLDDHSITTARWNSMNRSVKDASYLYRIYDDLNTSTQNSPKSIQNKVGSLYHSFQLNRTIDSLFSMMEKEGIHLTTSQRQQLTENLVDQGASAIQLKIAKLPAIISAIRAWELSDAEISEVITTLLSENSVIFNEVENVIAWINKLEISGMKTGEVLQRVFQVHYKGRADMGWVYNEWYFIAENVVRVGFDRLYELHISGDVAADILIKLLDRLAVESNAELFGKFNILTIDLSDGKQSKDETIAAINTLLDEYPEKTVAKNNITPEKENTQTSLGGVSPVGLAMGTMGMGASLPIVGNVIGLGVGIGAAGVLGLKVIRWGLEKAVEKGWGGSRVEAWKKNVVSVDEKVNDLFWNVFSKGIQTGKTSQQNLIVRTVATTAVALGMLWSMLPGTTGNVPILSAMTDVVVHVTEQQNRGGIDDEQFMKITAQTTNEHYVSYYNKLQDGIQLFQSKHPSIPVVWQRSDLYLSDAVWFKIATAPFTQKDLDNRTGYKDMDFTSYIGEYPFECLWKIIQDGKITDDEVIPLRQLLISRLPEYTVKRIGEAGNSDVAYDNTKLGTMVTWQSTEDRTRIIDTYYNNIQVQIVKYLEAKGEQKISEPELLSLLLENNNGNLNQALWDWTGFFKWLVRGNNNHESEQGEIQISWLQQHVEDQVNPHFNLNSVPFTNARIDKNNDQYSDSVVSIAGMWYHGPHEIALLSEMSPNAIKMATWWEYAANDHVAEEYKSNLDMQNLDQLEKIQALLESYLLKK